MCRLRTLASILLMLLSSVPAAALERLPKPDGGEAAVVHVADLERGDQGRVYRRGSDTYWQWRYRAAYTRWMHNEYVRAGYPVRHRQFRTYARAIPCCCCGWRHWHW